MRTAAPLRAALLEELEFVSGPSRSVVIGNSTEALTAYRLIQYFFTALRPRDPLVGLISASEAGTAVQPAAHPTA